MGGYALAAHGHPRYTGDIDIWVKPSADNVARLLGVLDEFGFRSLGLTASDFMQPQAVIQLGYPPARIDLLTSIDGVEFDACFSRRQALGVDGLGLNLIALEDFRANKLATGRAKDLADLQSLDEASPDASNQP